jgi:flagellin-like hook-associated protein FlgL
VTSIGYASNSIKILGSLRTANQEIGKSFERLSSGLRINSAIDDASGLALSERLNTDANSYSIANRNISDGISRLSVTEVALSELESILARAGELASSAKSSTLTNTQRGVLDAELQGLTQEYNRILETTTFNDSQVFALSSSNVALQAGPTVQDSIQISLGGAGTISLTAGDGTFQSATSVAVGAAPAGVATADFNGDGNLDLVSTDRDAGQISVLLGNGDGTFQARTSIAVGTSPLNVITGDFNNDGNEDIISFNRDSNNASLLRGNGDGTFQAAANIATGNAGERLIAADFNGDGRLDFASADFGSNSMGVYIGNGDGTFQARVSYVTGLGPNGIFAGDINNDSIIDLVVSDYSGDTVSFFLGNGDGTFAARTSMATGANPATVEIVDFNNDGTGDLLVGDNGSSSVSVYIGNGNGTFGARLSMTVGSFPFTAHAVDINEDGNMDIVTPDSGSTSISVILGNGNGTFKARVSFATAGFAPFEVAFGDFNGDSGIDIVSADSSSDVLSIFQANISTSTANSTDLLSVLSGISIATRVEAVSAQERIDAYSVQVSRLVGIVGAQQSRLSFVASSVITKQSLFSGAVSRIRDADIAVETASLLSAQIRSSTATAMLTQANQQIAQVLKLLA